MSESLTQTCRRGWRASRRALGFCLREPRAALLTARMAFWVVSLSLLVRVMPLPRVMRLMKPRRRAGLANPNHEEIQTRLAGRLDALLRTDFWVFTPTCWKRAPVLYRYLALNGVESRIIFGMREEDEGSLAGHAWLEAAGRPLLEMSHPAYAVTYVFPPVREKTRAGA